MTSNLRLELIIGSVLVVSHRPAADTGFVVASLFGAIMFLAAAISNIIGTVIVDLGVSMLIHITFK
jgi:hypothetical protein